MFGLKFYSVIIFLKLYNYLNNWNVCLSIGGRDQMVLLSFPLACTFSGVVHWLSAYAISYYTERLSLLYIFHIKGPFCVLKLTLGFISVVRRKRILSKSELKLEERWPWIVGDNQTTPPSIQERCNRLMLQWEGLGRPTWLEVMLTKVASGELILSSATLREPLFSSTGTSKASCLLMSSILW